MPTVRTNQNLRQTVANKSEWDTLTFKGKARPKK